MCQVVPAYLGDCRYSPWDSDNIFSDGEVINIDGEVSDLLTPPGSPSDYDGAMTTSSSRCCSPEYDDNPVWKDCMWSAGLSMPGINSRIGLGVWSRGDLVVDGGDQRHQMAMAVSESAVITTVHSSMSDFELKGKNINLSRIDVATTSPPSLTQLSSSSVAGDETPSTVVPAAASISTSSMLKNIDGCFDEDEDSSEDVDVVSVGPTPTLSSCPSVSQTCNSSSVRELLVMPRSTSFRAHVNAMHNYSTVSVDNITSPSVGSVSTVPCPRGATSKVNAAYRRPAYSAPQSPAAASHRRQWREKGSNGDFGSMSMPCSPAAGELGSSSKQQLIRNHRQHSIVRHGRRVATRHGGCSDSEDGGPVCRRVATGGKRALHNVLERRRRDHLKWNFETLRSVVPSTAHNSRMPKVAILRRARDFVRHLRSTAERLEAERNRQRSLYQRWQHKLALLVSGEQYDDD